MSSLFSLVLWLLLPPLQSPSPLHCATEEKEECGGRRSNGEEEHPLPFSSLVLLLFGVMNSPAISSSSRGLEKRKMALLSMFDHLYCQEESLGLEEEAEEEAAGPEPALPVPEVCDCETERLLVEAAAAAEEEWKEVLRFLLGKETEALTQPFPAAAAASSHCYLRSAREEAVEWLTAAAARHGFSTLTALLAVNYFDRCFLAGGRGVLRLQEDKPWMGRLAAVACLSLAAKVEETYVPFLLDLQVPALAPPAEGGFVFEPKTIRRMELLVLSALGWRMNPVTPLSFVHHLLPRIYTQNKSGSSAGGGIAARIRESARSCEAALLSVIVDWSWVQHPASAWAAAALLQVAEFGDGGTEPRDIHRLISLLDSPKEELEQCYRLMAESTAIVGHKRKHPFLASSPPSPSGVIGSCFSCESSCDSWAMWPSSVSSSPEVPPPFKRLNGAIINGVDELAENDATASF